ncbi:MAG TPA: class I SAM-dependent methyltransferase [Bryobacteraceae bacterium]|nr:class I SAM-dependent methyltransferase [Bryobacteraceae bacterium]
MDSNLRLAWTQIVTADDYDEHMAAVGQAQAAAALTAELIQKAALHEGSRLVIVGAGTGHMFDFLNIDLFRPFHLICTDLNPTFLARLRARLLSRGFGAQIAADDLEHTSLLPHPDFLLATLLLEHIDWRKGIEAITALRPAACGIIIQENPPGMTTAITPGRRIPPSMAAAAKIAQPKLVPQDEMLRALETRGYHRVFSNYEEVADAKQLVSTLLVA